MRVQQPSPAERARTVLRLSPYLRVRVPGARGEVDLHGTDPDGSVVLVVPDDHPVARAARPAADSLPVLLDATDVCPVPVADRVRGRARLVGWVHEPPAHLRRELALVAADREGAGALLDIGGGRTVLYVDVAEVQLVDGSADPDEVAAVVCVDREDYAAAAPDPLAGVEAALLCHLVDDHPAELARLAGLLPAAAAGRGPGDPGPAGPARAAAAGRRRGRPADLRRAADLPGPAARPDARAAGPGPRGRRRGRPPDRLSGTGRTA